MEEALLTSPAFWLDDTSLVMVNDRDDRAVAEAGMIRAWLKNRKDLSAHILFSTSGSSGVGKWVALSKDELLVSAKAVNAHLGLSSEDRWMLTLPTFHVGGMGVCARVYDAGCSLSVYKGKWDVERFALTLQKDRVTIVSLVPTQLVDLVNAGVVAPSTLRSVLIGGGRLSASVYQRAVELGWPIVETYGMTETASQVATAEPGSRELKLLPIWQAKTDASGRLMLQGDALMSGYVTCQGEDVLLSKDLNEGWFLTSDMVHLDSDTLSVVGRADRCVKILGELVNLDEVVQCLLGLCGAEEGVEIVALDDPRKGAHLIAVSESLILTDYFLAAYNAQCNPLWRIDQQIKIDAFPRSPLGKIQHTKLYQMTERSLIQGG